MTIDEVFWEAYLRIESVVLLLEETNKNSNLRESTKFGNKYMKDLNNIVGEFKKFNTTLKYRIEHDEKPKKDELEFIISDLDELKSPNIMKIMSMVFKNPRYDEEDKENVHKTCAIYAQMYQEFEHRIYQLRLKYVDMRDLNLKGFKI